MLNVIYDATQLIDGECNKAFRRGIYFVSLNILKELLKKKDVKVHLWSTPSKSFLLSNIRTKIFPSAAFFYERNLLIRYISKKTVQLRAYAEKKGKKNVLRKFLWSLILLGDFLTNSLFSISTALFSQPNGVFFSPQDAVPRCFRRKKNLTRFIILYDAIPLKLADYSHQKEKGWFANLIKKITISDFYFCISEETKKDFCHFFPQLKKEHMWVRPLAADNSFKPVIDPLIFDHIKRKYQFPQEKKYIFSLCTLEPRKNLIRAVKSFIKFIKKNNIQDLVWVMGGAQYENFSEKIKKESQDFDKYVKYVGYIDDEDLPSIYSNAEWFVFTSQYEGFGLPPLEAMQCGCPVITSNNSSLPEVIGDAGILIDWDSDEQHVEAYEKYYFNMELREEKQRKGLERAQTFSWKKTIDEMVNVMKKNVS